jgi:hypothetical protein
MNEEKRRQLLPSAEEELAAARTIHLQFGNCEIIWRKARKGKLIAYCLWQAATGMYFSWTLVLVH